RHVRQCTAGEGDQAATGRGLYRTTGNRAFEVPGAGQRRRPNPQHGAGVVQAGPAERRGQVEGAAGPAAARDGAQAARGEAAAQGERGRVERDGAAGATVVAPGAGQAEGAAVVRPDLAVVRPANAGEGDGPRGLTQAQGRRVGRDRPPVVEGYPGK